MRWPTARFEAAGEKYTSTLRQKIRSKGPSRSRWSAGASRLPRTSRSDAPAHRADKHTNAHAANKSSGECTHISALLLNANTANLQVRVTLTPAQVGAGLAADLSVTRGLASKLDLALNSLLDPISGRLHFIDDGFQTTIDDFKKEIARQNQINDDRRNSLLRQFASLEQTVSQLQSIGNYLTAQFGSLASSTSKK